MANNTTKIIAGVLAVAGIYFIYKYFNKPKPKITPSPTPEPTPTPTPTSLYPIKKGSKGNKVKELQKLLLKIDSKSLPKYGADGDFGSETEAALVKYLGKKTVDSADDITKLNDIYNKRILVFPSNKGAAPQPLFLNGINL